MGALKALTWQNSTASLAEAVKKVEKFLRDICIYEYKSIYSHV
tara:strand:+ start:4320 stop:4448 length:129 start_codon:yes stop_codon:yes gene_type:complete